MSSDVCPEQRYRSEKEFFDRQATEKPVLPTPKEILERYSKNAHAELFGKEMMFRMLGDPTGKRVLEVGCGEGQASVQLAYCGADVTGLDISAAAIEAGKKRAELDGVNVAFRQANLETDEFGENEYDVVWCDMILHHVVPSLDKVMETIHRTLKPGGMFIAREPIAYANWLKALRRALPIYIPETPDEQPLRQSEFDIIQKYFPDTQQRNYRLLARIDCLTQNLPFLRFAARLDNAILNIPGMKSLAGDVLISSTKT